MNQNASLAELRSLDCYPELFSEAEQRQVDEWISGGLVVKTDRGLLNITEAGERAYWSRHPGARAQEVVDALDENIMGVLADANGVSRWLNLPHDGVAESFSLASMMY
jgi:hypothetical protein